MTEETTINETDKEETKEKAKKDSNRAIRKRAKEKTRKRLLSQEQRVPVTERVITRDAYEKRKDYKEALIEQAAELYEIEEIYKIFAQKRVNNGNTENISTSNIGDVISIQHTDENGEKTFSPPMKIEGIEKDENGKATSYILRDMNGKQHILSNMDSVILPIMNKNETLKAYEKGKSEIEKEKEGPKKLQKRISQYQSDIEEYANKDTSAWKDDYLKAPEKPKEQENGGKVNIDIANDDIKAVVEKCPNLVLDYMEENKINIDGLDLSDCKTKTDKSEKILDYLGSKEFDTETSEKLSEYLKDKDKRFEEYKTKPLKLKSVQVSDEAKFACNAVPTNVQDEMKELGIIPKDTKWMNSKALMDYMKKGDHLTFTQEKLDEFEKYMQDKPARQQDYLAYMKKTKGRSR